MTEHDVHREKPESLRLRQITPSLTVSDIGASITWYRDVIGFHVVETHERDGVPMACELLAGTEPLFISQDDFAKGRDRVKGVGLRFYLETVQDVDELAANIKARGGVLESEPTDMPWGSRAFSVVDPDGFAFTIASIQHP